ncbi:PhzF family phenazine biosynthesis protein [Tistrella mobilis]|uniref:PhzF family phenazine biosynthesis protein n=1 Tax=Tistrella mobilis TaxID=171437 RepID=UPI0035577360
MRNVRIFHLDAFAERLFAGNPAAVCLMDAWLPVPVMQAIAAENRLSETAFLVPEDPGGFGTGDGAAAGPFHLRWFTPTTEMPMCGHATLAAAHVVLSRLAPEAPAVVFRTRGGLLHVARDPEADDRLCLSLPRERLTGIEPRPALLRAITAALGDVAPAAVLEGRHDWYVLMEDPAEVEAVRPDDDAIAALPPRAVAVASLADGAALADGADYVCRFFAPKLGVPEDPVTGIVHAGLAPLFADMLARDRLDGLQLSPRRGRVTVMPRPDHVMLTGRVVEYSEGRLVLNRLDVERTTAAALAVGRLPLALAAGAGLRARG